MRDAVLAATLGVTLAAASPAPAMTVRDMLGRDVTLAAPPARIVSLVPSATETIYALGGDARLVGVTDFCDWPPAARTKPRVGGMVDANLEAIAALRPDLVVATDEGNREETFEQLRRIGVPTFLVHANSVAEMLEMIGRLGELTGRSAAVAPLVGDITRRIERIRDAVRPFRPPRVLYVLWPEPLIVPGHGSLITELIELAGGQSITAADPGAYPRLSLEVAVARAPDIIVLADHSGSGSGAGRQSADTWRRLASMPAIRSGRLYSVDLSLLHRYGPRVPDGLETLARLLHPEAFR